MGDGGRGSALGLGVGDLCTGEGEEEEEEGAGKLAGHGNEVVSHGIWSDYGSVRVHYIVIEKRGVQKAQEWNLSLLRSHGFRLHARKHEASSEMSRLELVHDGRCSKRRSGGGSGKLRAFERRRKRDERQSAEQAMIYTLIPSNDRSRNNVCKAKSKLITSTVGSRRCNAGCRRAYAVRKLQRAARFVLASLVADQSAIISIRSRSSAHVHSELSSTTSVC